MNKFEKSGLHKVTKLGEGKYKHFEVESISKEKYQVQVYYSCTCRYFSVHQKPCSHIICALTEEFKKEE
jgi:hypothetical protein